MPIYEYECLKCGERFELLRNVSDSEAEARCPRCGYDKAGRVLSTFATTSSDACAPGGSS